MLKSLITQELRTIADYKKQLDEEEDPERRMKLQGYIVIEEKRLAQLYEKQSLDKQKHKEFWR